MAKNRPIFVYMLGIASTSSQDSRFLAFKLHATCVYGVGWGKESSKPVDALKMRSICILGLILLMDGLVWFCFDRFAVDFGGYPI